MASSSQLQASKQVGRYHSGQLGWAVTLSSVSSLRILCGPSAWGSVGLGRPFQRELLHRKRQAAREGREKHDAATRTPPCRCLRLNTNGRPNHSRWMAFQRAIQQLATSEVVVGDGTLKVGVLLATNVELSLLDMKTRTRLPRVLAWCSLPSSACFAPFRQG